MSYFDIVTRLAPIASAKSSCDIFKFNRACFILSCMFIFGDPLSAYIVTDMLQLRNK